MSRIFKRLAKKVAPSLAEQFRNLFSDVASIKKELQVLKKDLSATNEKLHKTEIDLDKALVQNDRRIDNLKKLASKVEPYQPAYAIDGIIQTPKRDSADRAQAILNTLDSDMRGYSVLDVGSSFGYMAFYLCDRGAEVEAWEASQDNHNVAKAIQDINGVPAKLRLNELNPKTVKEIPHNSFDVALGLSIFHHIIHDYGLRKTKNIISELMDRIPILIVELAKKGEDSGLWWDAAQPKSELDIFEGLDVTIEKIGSFDNHLSQKKRPMYKISKKSVTVNKKRYIIEDTTRFAYPKSPVLATKLKRQYLKTKSEFLKVYFFNKEDKDNTQQIINEINFFNSLHRMSKSHPTLPVMKDFEVGTDKAVIVFQKIDGELADQSKQKTKNLGIDKIFGDIFNCLIFMESTGYYHNDLRSWNIMVADSSVKLIDFGLVSTKPTENNAVAFLWALHAMATGKRESYAQDKKILPPKKVFKSKAKLSHFYELVKAGEDSFISIKKQLSEKSAKSGSSR